MKNTAIDRHSREYPLTSPKTGPIAATPALSYTLALRSALDGFLQTLAGKNRSQRTITAYRSDLEQFFGWLAGNNATVTDPADIVRADISSFFATPELLRLTGVTRARKLAAFREFFRHLVFEEVITKSPAEGLDTPKKEYRSRNPLRPDEYSRLLAAAGADPRDFAILQVFLQTGVRVSELCSLALDDVDIAGHVLHVRDGKGQTDRDIDLEKKAIQAIKNYLNVRPESLYPNLFLNRYGEPIGERGVRKLVAKHLAAAGVTKKASPHTLRHTFATAKATKGVSPFQLKEWLGHRNLNTTQIYVHLARQNGKKVMEATSL